MRKLATFQVAWMRTRRGLSPSTALSRNQSASKRSERETIPRSLEGVFEPEACNSVFYRNPSGTEHYEIKNVPIDEHLHLPIKSCIVESQAK